MLQNVQDHDGHTHIAAVAHHSMTLHYNALHYLSRLFCCPRSPCASTR